MPNSVPLKGPFRKPLLKNKNTGFGICPKSDDMTTMTGKGGSRVLEPGLNREFPLVLTI